MLRKLAVLGLVLMIFPVGVLAMNNDYEQSGDYPEARELNMRVRVFIHHGRDAKPGPGGGSEQLACSDPNVNDLVGTTGWHLDPSVGYWLNLGSAPAGINLRSASGNAFATWSTASGVQFTEVGTTKLTRNSLDYKNIVAWGKTPGNALGVTYTRYYTDTGRVADVDTILNSRVKWVQNLCTVDAYEVGDILTHELGHWMGLGDEYAANYIDNTMYGYGDKAEMKKNTLEDGDVGAVLGIYQH